MYYPIPKAERDGKLGPVRTVGVLVGYADDSPSYRVWDPYTKKKVKNVSGVEFDETVGKGWWLGDQRASKGDMGAIWFPDLEGDGGGREGA